MAKYCKMIGYSVATRSFSTSGICGKIKNVTVIGGGTMGNGISQVAAQAGNIVNLVDLNDAQLQKARNSMENSLQRIAKKLFKVPNNDYRKPLSFVKQPKVKHEQLMQMNGEQSKADDFIQETLSRVTFSTNMRNAVSDADLILEAIVENVDIKRKLFQDLDKLAPEKTIFASNTSSIPISEIAELVKRKDRFGGLHFFSPVPLMKLLEVIRIPETSDDTFQSMNFWGSSIGKVTVSCKDTPGFIVNRLLIPYSLEALRMLERGDATVKDIDTAMKLGAGYPMGPFELSDNIGLDVSLSIREGWEKRFPGNPNFKVPEILRKKVREGKLGVKSGEGWYKYSKK